MDKERLVALLKKEMVPAMGCTEPAAAALAGAKARELLCSQGFCKVERAQVFASRDIVKNAMGVSIPNCEIKGILAAVALGISGGSSSQSLSILSNVSQKQKEEASLINLELVLVSKVPPLFVSVKVFGKSIDEKETEERGPKGSKGSKESCVSHEAVATIAGEHDRFSYLEKDGNVLLDLPLESEKSSSNVQEKENDRDFLKTIKLDDIIEFANCISINDVPFVLDAVKTNLYIAKHAIDGEYGLQVGKTTLEDDVDKVPTSLSQAFDIAASYAAAGSDARMSGCSMPVVINSGSGNQGITVTVPVYVVAKYLGCDDEKLVRAVCVSQLVALSLTARKNRLSALCGAFTASIGTSCAYVYLLGGDRKAMDRAVNTMVGNLTGIICDGAKNTCALKIYSCLQASALSVKLSLKGFAPGPECGIVGSDCLESMGHLSRISCEGMEETDKTIMSIMMNKKC